MNKYLCRIGPVLICLAATLFCSTGSAATFTADFNPGTVPAGSSVSGSAIVTTTNGVGNSGVLKLTENVGGQVGNWLINDFSSGAAVNAFNATFKVELGPVAGADGFSFNWGTNLTGVAGEEGEGNGLTIAFDTFDNGASEAPAIDIKWQGNVIAHSATPFNFSAANAAFVTVQVTLTNGLVTVIWNSTTVHSGIALAGFPSFSGAKFGFGARTGGVSERHYIDDVSIVTTPGSGSTSLVTMNDTLQTDVNGNTRPNPGDTLRYTVIITNNTAGTLSNVVFNSGAVPNAPQVGGSLRATPLARADAPATNSAPGSAFHGALNVALNIPAGSGLLANDFLGVPSAQIASFGGGSFGGNVTAFNAGITSVMPGVGQLTVNADGSLNFAPDAGFNGIATFQYRLTNSTGFSDGAVTLAIGIRPSAANDSFNVTGNTMLDSSLIPQTLLANDAGSLIGISANTAPANGTVTILANGNFLYTPNPGFTGANSFNYTITNGFGAVSATVNLTVANRIWYIDNSVVANGDGRSISPFKQTSDFTAANLGGAGQPADNDRVFLRQGTGNYTGGTTLRVGQRLIGDGAVGTFASHFGFSLAPGSARAAGVAVPAITGTRPFISVASGTAVSLNTDNWVQGLNVNSANGRAVSGASVGFLILSNVTASATGDRVLNLVSGSVIARFDSASSTNSVDSGIVLSALGGSVTVNGGFITGAVSNDFVLSSSAASVDFAGAINNTAGRSVVISNQLGGAVTLSGNITDTGTGLIVQNCTGGTFTFSGASKSFNTAGNAAVTLTNNDTATFTFSNGGLAVTTTTGNAFQVLGSQGGVTVSGSGNRFTSGNGATFVNTGVNNGTIDINAPLTGTGRLIDIQNRTGGNVTLSGSLTNNPGTGMLIQNNSGGGIIALSGTTKIFNTGANTAVNLVNNTGTTINFTGGGLAVTRTSGIGFNATGGGTVTVTGAGNSIGSGSGIGLNVVNTTIGASGLTFQSVSANGAPSGIMLNNTGTIGLTVTGTGAAGSGGTIQNTTGDGVSLTTTRSTSLGGLNVSGAANHGVNANGVVGLTLTGCQISNNGNGDNEHGLNLVNISGTVLLDSTTFNGASEDLVHLENSNINATFIAQNGCHFTYPASIGGFANSAMLLLPGGNSSIAATVKDCLFTNVRGVAFQIGANTLNANGAQTAFISNNVMNVTLAGRASGVFIGGQELTTTTMTIVSNRFTGAGGNGVISVDVNDTSRVTGVVAGNTISNAPGIGMFFAVDEAGKLDAIINANRIANCGGDGIQTVNFGGVGVSNLRLTISTNTVINHSTNAAVAFVGAIAFVGFEDNSCVALRGNSISGTASLPANRCGGAPCVDYYVEEVGGTASVEEIPNTASTTANAAYIQSLNGPPGASVTIFGIIDLTNGGQCPAP